MKTKLLVVGLLAAASNVCLAGTFAGRAEVLDSRPLFVEVDHPVRICEQDQGYYQQAPDHSTAGSILGGLIGGIAAHQIGHGRGKTAATIAGTLGGAYLGNRVATQDGQPQYVQPQAQCHMENRRTREARGYRVTYRYDGRTFTENLPYDPGESLRVNVTVSPAN